MLYKCGSWRINRWQNCNIQILSQWVWYNRLICYYKRNYFYYGWDSILILGLKLKRGVRNNAEKIHMFANLINKNIDRERTRLRAKEEKNNFECNYCNRIIQVWQHSEKEKNRQPEFLCKFPEGMWIFFFIWSMPRFYVIMPQNVKSYSVKIQRKGMTKKEVILTTTIKMQTDKNFRGIHWLAYVFLLTIHSIWNMRPKDDWSKHSRHGKNASNSSCTSWNNAKSQR